MDVYLRWIYLLLIRRSLLSFLHWYYLIAVDGRLPVRARRLWGCCGLWYEEHFIMSGARDQLAPGHRDTADTSAAKQWSRSRDWRHSSCPTLCWGPINEDPGSWCWCFAELVKFSTFNFRTSIEPLSTMMSVLFDIFSYLVLILEETLKINWILSYLDTLVQINLASLAILAI